MEHKHTKLIQTQHFCFFPNFHKLNKVVSVHPSIHSLSLYSFNAIIVAANLVTILSVFFGL